MTTFGSKGPEDIPIGGVTLGIGGDIGTGKTVAAHTVVDYFKRPDIVGPHARALSLNAEGGLLSIKSRTDFRYEDITDWRQFEKITDDLIQTPNLRDQFPVIIVDNMTEIADFQMKSLLKGSDEPSYGGGEWRTHKRVVITRVRKLRDMARLQRVAVIFNIWDRTKDDEQGRPRSITVELAPSLAKPFGGALDLMGFLEVADDEGRRVYHMAQTERLRAKFRQDMLDPIVSQIPLDLYGPPSREGVLSLAPLVATLIGGEPFPVTQYAPPEGLRPSRFAAPVVKDTATNGKPERPPRPERVR